MILPKAVELTDEMAEILPSEENLEDTVLSDLSTLQFLSLLDYEDQIIVLTKMAGFRSLDAATIIGCGEGYISQRLGVIRLYAKVILNSAL